MSRRKTQEEFLRDAYNVHGDEYGYDKAIYVNAQTPVQIYCYRCEEYFWQIPHLHVNQKRGHLGCRNTRAGLARRVGEERFLERVHIIHKDKFDYSRMNFTLMREKIFIGCRKCGHWFWQFPYHHVKGTGCPECAKVANAERMAKMWDGSKRSASERYIHDILEEAGIPFDEQFEIPGGYSYDFIIPDLDLLIEYDGSQHYKAWGGDAKKLARKKKNDAHKDAWAPANGYDLIRIPYFENLEETVDILRDTIIDRFYEEIYD